MADVLVCWRCGGSIVDLPLPLSRYAECPTCGGELHVCRMCIFFDPAVSKACREPVAEEVKEKDRANFCGYFQPRPDAHAPRDETSAREARSALEALFGGDPGAGEATEPRVSDSDTDAARQALEGLFQKDQGRED